MTTAKIRTLLFLALLFFVCCSLCACGWFGDPTLPDFEPALIESESEEASSEESAPLASRFRLIIPYESSDDFLAKARAFGEALRKQTGIGWQILDDRSDVTFQSGVYDIILGWADHPLRRSRCEDIRREDYLCWVHARAMLLCGRSEATAEKAMAHFTERVLPYADLRLLDGLIFSVTGDYPLSEASLNGFSLGDYRIVCDGDEARLFYAEELQRRIGEMSGHVLPVLFEEVYDGSAPAFLLLGREEGISEAGLIPDERGVILRADGAFEWNRTLSELERLIFADKDGDGICHATLEEPLLFDTVRTKFAISLIVGSDSLSARRPEDVAAISDPILSERSDCFFGMGIPSDLKEYLKRNLYGYEVTEEESLYGVVLDGSSRVLRELLCEEIPFAAMIGKEDCGFHFVLCKGNTPPPAEITESDQPWICLRYEETDVLNEESGAVLAERIQTNGSSICVYGSASESLSLEWSVQEDGVGALVLFAEVLSSASWP